jgi:Family of unknown function (DUF6308)
MSSASHGWAARSAVLKNIQNDMCEGAADRENNEVDMPYIVIAEQPVPVAEALERLENYPKSTPAIYDYPGPGKEDTITVEEIARTRKVSSRISRVHGEWFITMAQSAPWTPSGGDLRDAYPDESGGLYDQMLDLYNHFASAAPSRIGIAKISKVLHLKRPTQFPILDSRLTRAYKSAAARAASACPRRGHKYMYWAAIRSDLQDSADGIAELRIRMAAHPSTRVQSLGAVSDLRLHDMLTW